MRRIGFIGLGLMGRPMAHRLLEHGFALTVWNRTAERARTLLDAGAGGAASPREVADRSEVVIIMVSDAAASEQVICGGDGVLDGAAAGLLVIDMSSIAPEASRAIADRVRAKGSGALDAPVTGNPSAAETGRLGIMVGGDEDLLEACRPILQVLGTVILHVGPNGAGTTLKIINNLVLAVTIEAVAEALVLARKAGIDPARVVEIAAAGGAQSRAMETRGPRMIAHDFEPRSTVGTMYKDLSAALRLAEAFDAPMPAGAAALEILRAARAQGKGELDSASVVTALEQLANLG